MTGRGVSPDREDLPGCSPTVLVEADEKLTPNRGLTNGEALLKSPGYLGEAIHKGTSNPGEHEAIVGKALWDKVQAILSAGARQRAARTRAQTPALLKILIFGPTGCTITPAHCRNRDVASNLFRLAQCRGRPVLSEAAGRLTSCSGHVFYYLALGRRAENMEGL